MFHVVIILMEAEKIWMVLIFSNYLQDVHIKDSFIKKIVRLLNHFERRRCDFPIRLHLSWDLSRNAFVHFFQSWSLYSTNVGQSELPLGSPFFQLPFSSLIRPTPVEATLIVEESPPPWWGVADDWLYERNLSHLWYSHAEGCIVWFPQTKQRTSR